MERKRLTSKDQPQSRCICPVVVSAALIVQVDPVPLVVIPCHEIKIAVTVHVA